MNTNTDGYFTNPMSRSYSWRSLPILFAYIAIYALTIGLASLLWQRPVALTLTYVLLSALLLWRWHAFSDLLYFALPAILGPIGEFVAVGFGAWEYTLPLLNIPVWLPLAWGISGLCLKKNRGSSYGGRPNNSLQPTLGAARFVIDGAIMGILKCKPGYGRGG